ncbi:hypothetical protein JCM6882_003709 [Rhodosporidiobolus microsporus]
MQYGEMKNSVERILAPSGADPAPAPPRPSPASEQYLIAEAVELAGNAARDSIELRITPHHIRHAFCHDVELSNLLTILAKGGYGLGAELAAFEDVSSFYPLLSSLLTRSLEAREPVVFCISQPDLFCISVAL